MGENKKKKEKYLNLRGKYFPIYLKSSEISLTDLRSVAYKVLHISKSAGFSQKYRNVLGSVKATAYRGDYFHQGFVAGLC